MTTSSVTRLGRDFWALWGASATANLGDAMYLIALPLLALYLHASPGQVALVTVLYTLAWPVLGLPVGMLADRVDRRRLVMLVNGGRAAVLAVLTLRIVTGSASLLWVYAAALLLGVGETIVDSTFAALIPATVRDPALLGRANARLEFAITVNNQFVGPPLAGLLVGIGLMWAVGTSSLLYLAAVPLLALMAGSYRPEPPARREPFLSAVTAGLAFVWRNRLIRSLTLITAAMNVFWSAWLSVLVVYVVAPGPVGLNPAGYGLLLAAMAIGGIAGSWLVEPMRRRLGDRRVLALDVVGTILLIGTPAVTTNAFAIGAAMIVGAAGSTVWRVIFAVIRQRLTPEHLLGRVYGASRVISWGVLPVGAGLGAAVADAFTVRTVFVVGGLASLVLLLAFAVTVRPSDLLLDDRAAPQSADTLASS